MRFPRIPYLVGQEKFPFSARVNTRRILPPAFRLLALLFLAFPALCLRSEDPEAPLARLFEESDLTKLAAEQKDVQVYRLTVLRSFDDPLQILIESDAGSSQVIVKKVRRESSGPEYRYTRLTRDSRFKIAEEAVKTLEVLLTAAEFGKMPGTDERFPGLDGSTWTLEAVRGGTYHKVVRDNPFLSVRLFEDLEKHGQTVQLPTLNPPQAYGQGLLAAVFSYLWALSGEDAEKLY